MRLVRTLTALCLALTLAGCGGPSAADQVKAKVQEFAHAVRAGDYARICRRVLAPALLDRLASARISCPQALRVSLAGVKDPTLAIGQVTVRGKRASVMTLSIAQGQRGSLQAIELVKTRAGWRIAALSSPAGGSSAQAGQ